MYELFGEAAEALIRKQIEAHRKGVATVLAPLDAYSAVIGWMDTLRAIEEFINLPLFALDDDEFERSLVDFRLDQLDPIGLRNICNVLTERFSESVAKRFAQTVMQSIAIGAAFHHHGQSEAAAGFRTVKHAIGYFQSRRRHLVALLYTLPDACGGRQPLERLDSLNLFLPAVENSGLTLTGLYQQLMLAKVFPDYRLLVGPNGFSGNRHFGTLDPFFLEPERASILEMQPTFDQSDFEQLEDIDSRLVFSAAELRNDLRLIEAAYAEFDLAGSTFGSVAKFLTACLEFCRDDYLVEIGVAKLDELLNQVDLPSSIRRRLFHSGGDYVTNLDVFAPFITVGSACLSTVTLMSRFAYYWKSVCLNRMRRFQIRSGFILEGSVKEALSNQGFAVSDVKRISGREFDVVATLGDTIYNVQCKNNLVDLSRIETDPARFARYNRQLDRYYAKALHKEEARELLLQTRFGLPHVRHVVVSRFPVATDNPRIMPFSCISSFRDTFAG